MKKVLLNRIKIVLLEKGKTSKWLATQLDKNISTVSRWCTNQNQPPLETIDDIAKLLKVDRRELIQPSNEK
ncbi:MAG: helix-turn-helix transcriptional regulator [Bacteroidota bacterium]